MSQRNFYQILGVTRNASRADIRAAFVRLAKLHHPDHARNASELPNRLHEVQKAYRCLSAPHAREEHDRALREGERLHSARQRSVQRRLQWYDGRHPHPQPRPRQSRLLNIRWRSLLVAIVSVIILARILNLAG